MYALCVSGAVNMQGFMWKCVCAIYTFSFIHLFIHSFILLYYVHTGGLGAVKKIMQRGETEKQTQAAKVVLELVSCEENRVIVKVTT